MLLSLTLGLSGELARAEDGGLVLADNMKVLRAEMPNETYRFVGSNAPGQLFYPKQTVNIRLDLAKGADHGIGQDFAIEIQEITTRNPEARSSGGWTDTSGNAPLIGLQGRATRIPIKVAFTDAPRLLFEVKNLPLPARFGTYAMILTRGTGTNAKRQFLGTLARVPQPRADGTIDNVPIFGEGALIDSDGKRADYYSRMGVRGWRGDGSWREKEDGTPDWAEYDRGFQAAKNAGCQIMVTLGAHPEWSRPFGDPTPAIGWTPTTAGYGATGDWLSTPAYNARYGKWLEAFVRRYWENGKGGLWGVENYNEPWEGGGISGWASDCLRYRTIQEIVAASVRKVDPRIKILASSTIMNTEDKLYSDGSDAMDSVIDIFTDHYVTPSGCYGPMVAKAHGKGSMETETWFANSEYSLAQGVVQFLASGQSRMSPWHPRVLFDQLPGNPDRYFIPTPVTVATAGFNYMVTGKPFEKMVFKQHLPYAFQFGKDKDKDGLVVVLGRLMPIGSDNFKVLLWSQVNGVSGGTLSIDNSDGMLKFFDLAGNPEHVGDKVVELPLTYLPTFIKSRGGPAVVAQRLMKASIEGKRFVEIVPHDFASLPNAPDAALRVDLRNRLNVSVAAVLTAVGPEGMVLKSGGRQAVTLRAGEAKTVVFPIESATLSVANAYPVTFKLTSPAGKAEYSETLNAAIVMRGTKKVDGDLGDWEGVPGVVVAGSDGKGDFAELLRRPWTDLQQSRPEETTGEFRLAWDDEYLYLCARVNDPSLEQWPFRFSERDENSYFHSAASDSVSPYKEFIASYRNKTGNPKRSFAEVPYVYCKAPENGIPFRRDRIQFGFDVVPGLHDMLRSTDVPEGFHAEPDTDYEYSLYWVDDQKNGSGELWRYLAPGVPRIHDWPHQVRGMRTTGLVPEARAVARREGGLYTYEAAIPRSELADLKLTAGTQFGFAFEIGNSRGANGKSNVFYGDNKAATKRNSLTLHPYWETSPSAGTRWTLVK